MLDERIQRMRQSELLARHRRRVGSTCWRFDIMANEGRHRGARRDRDRPIDPMAAHHVLESSEDVLVVLDLEFK